MKLPVFRQLPYISYSTYSKWKKCQHRVYLGKQSGLPFIQSSMGLAAQIGIAFDSFIKEWIVRHRKLYNPLVVLDKMLEGLPKETVDAGKALAAKYIKCKLVEKFLKYGDILVDQELYKNCGGIPILGRLDAMTNGLPFDWKTKAMASAKPGYPTKGASEQYTWYLDGPNSRWHDNICRDTTSLEEANPDWAEQFCFYNWLLGNEDLNYHVHELTMTNDGLVICEFQGKISKQFERTLRRNVERMWFELTDNMLFSEVAVPVPNRMLCEMYGTICEVAPHCKYYMDTLGNPERRAWYVQ